jgi:hypothetical protein
MPSVFLSHTSSDKPFVQKLANDLRRIGVDVWFDGWEIKVGESLTWKIEEGIRENEYLAVVLSPEAINSEWVRSELGAAWAKQMKQKKVVVLPILYRDCDMPLFLSDRRYADFWRDYQKGFGELAGALGINETDTISIGNWRMFAKSRSVDWQKYRKLEFEKLVTVLVDRAIQYNWSSWVGVTSNPFSVTLAAFLNPESRAAVSVKLNGRTHAYMASLKDVISPKNLRSIDFDLYVGNKINECEEFVWRRMEDFRRSCGDPRIKASHFVGRFLTEQGKREVANRLVNEMKGEMSWYKGDKLSEK